MTPAESAAAVGVLPVQIRRQTRNAVRRGLSFWRKLTLLGVTTRGIGRAIWGGNKLTTLKAIIKRDRDVQIGDGYIEGGLKITGLAALMETGGRTLPHDIKPKFAQRLAFIGKGGGLIRPLAVHHPGSRVPATPSAAPVTGEVGLYTSREVENGLKRAIQDAGLAN